MKKKKITKEEILEDVLYLIGNIFLLEIIFNFTLWALVPQWILIYAQVFRRSRNTYN